MKECKYCRETKPYDQFHEHKQTADGFDHRCKSCVSIVRKEERRIDRETRSNGVFEQTILKQDNKCPICEREFDSHKGTSTSAATVDHCHETNTFRGILCKSCNKALGSFGDSINMLEKALSYLKNFNSKHENYTG